jgi:hypothetical protein
MARHAVRFVATVAVVMCLSAPAWAVQSTKVDGKDSMKGKLSAGELGDGTFTGKRK